MRASFSLPALLVFFGTAQAEFGYDEHHSRG
jgi:hypothetical protein